ncbi:uncharacterized protein LOC124261345 [Haliotis rubra]|uniref:uncharacterized protein LOC124261345 n=1 Tax=Haliotis rubra TaxID=36100 RepID=UPI001EE61D93|nr:uncharacterized protein LOC124261345 [Haliotis rubra]
MKVILESNMTLLRSCLLIMIVMIHCKSIQAETDCFGRRTYGFERESTDCHLFYRTILCPEYPWLGQSKKQLRLPYRCNYDFVFNVVSGRRGYCVPRGEESDPC